MYSYPHLSMPMHHRKVAFSAKLKKAQLQAKREKKKHIHPSRNDPDVITPCNEEQISSLEETIQSSKSFPFSNSKICANLGPPSTYLDQVEEIGGSGRNKYNLKFKKAKKGSCKLAKLQHEPIKSVSEKILEGDSETFFPETFDYPKRPSWHKGMSKAELDRNENRNFRLFCEEIDKKYPKDELSLYELNLETWRQLWRVTEMSDILLIIVDARYCAAQFPPYLYKHLIEVEKKGVILVLNKCDLLPPHLVLAWQDYFTEKFPQLIVLPFSSYEGREIGKSTLKVARNSSLKLVEACNKIAKGNVDLSAWRRRIEREDGDDSYNGKVQQMDVNEDFYAEIRSKYKNGILTIGTIGHPNVGKSALINGLMGKKVVSVSKTPGHTKYFQTIFIAKNVKLCDCPGLVFPSLCPFQLQVVIGSYPIAQVRDPFSSIHYIASRIDLPKILKLPRPSSIDSDSEKFEWTPFLICEAWAQKRCYFVRTKGSCPDTFRAANELLRFTLVGFKDLIISLTPPGYSENKDKYISDTRCDDIKQLQGSNRFKHDSEHNLESSAQDDEASSVPSEESDSEEEEEGSSGSDDENSDSFKSCSNKFDILSVNG